MRWLDVVGLLGRDEIHVVSAAAGADITDRVVMVTGAGGSIGSELCRQAFGFGPRRLIMLDHDESNLHRLQLELWGEGLLENDDCIVADIRDRDRIDSLFAELKPDLVFHAAAHKHLPLLEKHPCEAVKSNVRGTENVLWAAIKHEADKFILISTDKAADPTSVLGATKRLAEVLVQEERGGGTTVAAVRFGNVLGSRGSLLSVLAEQIRSNLPITVTHPDMTRFFMTIEEAAGLVVEAAHLADRRGDLRPRHGRARAHPRHRAVVRPAHAPARRRGPLHGHAPGREAQRVALQRARASAPHGASADLPDHQRPAPSPGCTSSSAACTTPPPATTPRPYAASCAGSCRTTTRTRRWCPFRAAPPTPMTTDVLPRDAPRLQLTT